MKVKLPILRFAEEVNGRSLTQDDECERIEKIFYSIDSIEPFEGETLVFSGGEQFLCEWPVDQVEVMIDQARLLVSFIN